MFISLLALTWTVATPTPSLPLPVPIVQEVTVPKEPEFLTATDTLIYFADKYGANKDELLKVAKCESSLRFYTQGDNGKATGTMQFHKPTFETFAKEMGEKLDYNDPIDNIKLGAWAFAQGPEYKRHWSCWKKD